MRCEAPVPPEALARIRAPLEALGPQWVDPPVIQPLSVMLDLAGETMRARLFVVQDEGGREACLRPDFTVAIARAHMDGGAEAARYGYSGRAFRVAPQGVTGDHPEEFHQLGLEVFGAPGSPRTDAQVAGAAFAAAAAGGRKDLQLRFGDVALFGAFLEGIGVRPGVAERLRLALGRPRRLEALLDRAGAGAALSGAAAEIAGLPRGRMAAAVARFWAERGLEAVGGRTETEIAERIASQARAAREPRMTPAQLAAVRAYLALSGPPREVLGRALDLAGGAQALEAAAAGWEVRLAALSAAGIDLGGATLIAGFSRVFGYYDGFLFEVVSAALGPDAPLAAGGRYDGLTARLGGAACTAVGCMVRPARAAA